MCTPDDTSMLDVTGIEAENDGPGKNTRAMTRGGTTSTTKRGGGGTTTATKRGGGGTTTATKRGGGGTTTATKLGGGGTTSTTKRSGGDTTLTKKRGDAGTLIKQESAPTTKKHLSTMAARPIKSAHFSRECPRNGGGGDILAQTLTKKRGDKGTSPQNDTNKGGGGNVCYEPGHFSRECPQAGGDGEDSDNDNGCSNCFGSDHFAHQCPHLGGGGGQGGSSTGNVCSNSSNSPPHFSRECPQTAEDDESGAVQLPDCINCNSNGHNFFQCKMPPLNNNSNNNEPRHFSHTTSAAASPSKKVLARRHRHYNKKNRLSITVSSHARVPEKIKVNCRSKRYEVEGIIATYVHTNKETAYFVKWLGHRGTDANSWVLSVDTDCTETLVAFVNEANVDQIFSAILGQPVTEATRQQMSKSLKFHDVCARLNMDPHNIQIEQSNIAFLPAATQTDKQKAINKLPEFIRDCMTP